jgi:membrane protease YdiL (CAAX protease family)
MYWASVALFSGYILVPLLLSNIVKLINPFMPAAYLLFLQQCYTVLTWVIIFFVFNTCYPGFWGVIGLQPKQPASYYLWESVLLILTVVGLTLALNCLWQTLGVDTQHNNPYQQYSPLQVIVLSVFAVFIAPFQEELVFRGLVQSTFHKVSSQWRAVLLTGLVFLILHGSYFSHWPALAHVMGVGLCFGIWKERTNSLVPGIVAHLFNNIIASVMMLKEVYHL